MCKIQENTTDYEKIPFLEQYFSLILNSGHICFFEYDRFLPSKSEISENSEISKKQKNPEKSRKKFEENLSF